MSLAYSIINLLNIKDENISLLQDEVTTELFKGTYHKIIHAKLSYSPHECPHCQSKNIIKWGYKTSNIKLLKVAGFNSFLRLKKQRFLCKNCSKSFSAETNFVKKYCYISNNVKLAITLEYKKIFLKKILLLILMFPLILLIELLTLFSKSIYLIEVFYLKLYALMNLKLLRIVKVLWLLSIVMQILEKLLISYPIGAYHI